MVQQTQPIAFTQKNCALILLLSIFGTISSIGQIVGNPPVAHYTHHDFNSDAQFWDACQTPSGIMYFGNNYGALRFDGERWSKISLPNNSAVRSLHCSKNGTVYAGGYNEFGTIETDASGRDFFRSMRHLLPPQYTETGNIWEILELKNTIVLRSFNYLILIKDNNLEIIEASGAFTFVTIANDNLFVLDDDQLYILDPEQSQMETIFSSEEINNESFLEIFDSKNPQRPLLLTKEGSLFEISLETRSARHIQQLNAESSGQTYTAAIKSSSGDIYIGTLSNKLSTWSLQNQRFKKLRTYSELQDQTVLNLYESREGAIWVLLNKGLDYFDPNTPLTNIIKGPSVYDATIFENQFYVATNQGVFQSEEIYTDSILDQNNFKKTPMLEGQTWSLQPIGNQLFCAHDRGLFRIKEKQLIQIKGFSGVWKLFPVSGTTDLYFVCTYNGLGLIQITENSFSVLRTQLSGFNESTRDLINIPEEEDSYWVCHGYKGVFKIKTNEDHSRVVSTEHFNEQHGLPSPFNINVHRWNNQNIFSTNNGLYVFDTNQKAFKPHQELNALLGRKENIRQLVQQGDTTWCVIDDRIGFFGNDMQKVITNPFLSLKGTLNRGMECIVPLEKTNEVLLGTTNGLFAFHPGARSRLNPAQLNTTLAKVTYTLSDTTNTINIKNNEEILIFPHKVKNLNFEFAAPFIRDKENIRYSYRLMNQMQEWSEWQEEPWVNFPFLKSGSYALQVKATSLSGENAQPAQVKFSIQPAWYAAWPWNLFWILMFAALVYAAIRIIITIIIKEKEKTRLEEQKLQELRGIEQENQRIHQEKERIEADIIEKSKDLANNAVLIAKKRELLIDIQAKLNEIRQKAKNDYTRTNILNIVRNIELNLNDEEQYQLFDTNLERVHKELFDELKIRYPKIGSKDLRMCAFIKMELTNKEMASIFNISVRGVETARYRLKKKHPGIENLIEQEG